MNRKQGLCTVRELPTNYSTIVFNFDVCRVSQPVSSTNYAIDLETLYGTPFPGAARVYG